jgi:hypothetical protein
MGSCCLAAAGDLRGNLVTLLGALALIAAGAGALGWLAWWQTQSRWSAFHNRLLALLLLCICTLTSGKVSLSDDIHRYAWEGRVQQRGLATPYLHVPSDPALPDEPAGSRARVAHPDVSAAYPPLALLALRVITSVADATRTGTWVFQVFFGLCHVLTAYLLLVRAGRGKRRDRVLATLASLHPLALLEAPLGAHLDALAALLATAGLCVWPRSAVQAAPLLAAAAMVKPWALLYSPLLLTCSPRAARATLVFGATLVVLLLPYAAAGWRLLAGLGEYATRWTFNPGLFGPLQWVASQPFEGHAQQGRYLHVLISAAGLGIEDRGAVIVAWGTLAGAARIAFDGQLVARGLAAGLVCTAMGYALKYGSHHSSRLAWVCAVALFSFSPTVHPWYGINLIPLCALAGGVATLIALAVLPVTYAVWRADGGGVTWAEPWWSGPLFWGVFAGAVLWDLRRWTKDAAPTQTHPRPSVSNAGRVP